SKYLTPSISYNSVGLSYTIARPSTIISCSSPAGSMARISAIRISRWGRWTFSPRSWRSSHCVIQTAKRWSPSGYSSFIVSSPMQRSMNSSLVSFCSGVGIGIVLTSRLGLVTQIIRLVNRPRIKPANRHIPARNWWQVEDLRQLVRGHDAAVHQLDKLQFCAYRRILQPVRFEHDLIPVTDLAIRKKFGRE